MIKAKDAEVSLVRSPLEDGEKIRFRLSAGSTESADCTPMILLSEDIDVEPSDGEPHGGYYWWIESKIVEGERHE